MKITQLRYSLRQLRYFVAAAETLSFTAAAKLLHVSQPSVSTALSDIEETFGVQLFIRHHAQGLSLTQAGHSLLRDARMLLRHAEALQSEAMELGDKLSGRIAFGCLVSLAPQAIPRLRRQFLNAYPDIQLDIVEADQEILFNRLFDGSLEIALSYDLQVPPEIEFTPLATLPPFAILPVDHPLVGKADLSLSDLAKYPHVLLDLPLSREYFLSLFSNEKLTPNIAYRSSSAEVMRGIVANGGGVGLLNFPLGNLQALDGQPFTVQRLSDKHQALSLGLMRIQQPQERRVIQHFTEFCQEHIPALASWNRVLDTKAKAASSKKS